MYGEIAKRALAESFPLWGYRNRYGNSKLVITYRIKQRTCSQLGAKRVLPLTPACAAFTSQMADATPGGSTARTSFQPGSAD